MTLNFYLKFKINLKNFSSYSTHRFVPKHESPTVNDVNLLRDFILSKKKIFVITGAGISTESGIPDYRSEGVGLYNRSNYRPMTIQEFLSSAESRRRYWARNFVGWPTFSSRIPNMCHVILKKWNDLGFIHFLVTQNVDSLHEKAGLECEELHGTTKKVICLSCGHYIARDEFQIKLDSLNFHLGLTENNLDSVRPDGDIELRQEQVKKFQIPPCSLCNGILKPDVVFFGDNVKRSKVDKIYKKLMESDAMLVLGSSLQVFSSFRFAIKAHDLKIPIVIVNLGPTRADSFAHTKLSFRVGEILSLINL